MIICPKCGREKERHMDDVSGAIVTYSKKSDKGKIFPK